MDNTTSNQIETCGIILEGSTVVMFPKPKLLIFIFHGILICTVSILGLIGNTLSIAVFSRREMRSSINFLLSVLAVFDSLFLVTVVQWLGFPAIVYYYDSCFIFTDFWHTFTHTLIIQVLYPVTLTAQTGGIFITLAVTLERYIAVCYPLRARSWCTHRNARFAVIFVCVFSVAYNLPRFFEDTIIDHYHPLGNGSVWHLVDETSTITESYYTGYKTWSYFALMSFLPSIFLVIFNGAIYIQILKCNKNLKTLSPNQSKEICLAKMLFCVVAIYLVTSMMYLIAGLLETTADIFYWELSAFNNLLVIVNSGINFVIYYIMGTQFREQFWSMIYKCKSKCSRNSKDSTASNTVSADTIASSKITVV